MKKKLIISLVLTTLFIASQSQTDSKHLSSDTPLYPQGKSQGFLSDRIIFKGGTNIILNAKGEVIQGIPTEDKNLYPQGKSNAFLSDRIVFKAGFNISFNEIGEVITGTLAEDRILYPQGKTKGFLSDRITFKAGCCIVFNRLGEVESGTIAEERILYPEGKSKGFLSDRVTYHIGSSLEFNLLGEVSASYEATCQCVLNSSHRKNNNNNSKVIDEIIDGELTDYDKTVTKVLKRNNWEKMLIVVDITKSMYVYSAQVYLWILNNGNSKTRYVVFFNDGNQTSNAKKEIGITGGVYGTANTSASNLLDLMKSTITKGDGGDTPENDLEALLYGMDNCATCESVVHVCDNNATPRDVSLLNKVKKPVKVIVCGVNEIINTKWMDVAYKTKGSIHTLHQDVYNLSDLSIGESITIDGHRYKLTADGFVSFQ